jgi:MFS family permease
MQLVGHARHDMARDRRGADRSLMRAVLSQPAFRNLWAGQSLSSIGDAMVIVVIGLFVTDLTGSAGSVGLVLAAYAGPLVLFLLIGGVMADRFPRRAVMVATDLVRAALHGVLALLIALDAVEVWHMVVIGVFFGAAEAFFRPAYTGLLPQTVAEEDIQQAQAVTSASRETAIIVGPAIGTALVFGVGAAWAFALDALTFLASAAFLLRVAPRPRGAAHVRSTVLEELREGWAEVRSRAWVWATIAAFSVTLLAGLAPFFTLGASIAEERYGEAAVYGVMQVVWGAGTLTGALLGVRWRPRLPLRTAMLWALAWPPCFAAFALGAPIPALIGVTVVSGLGIGLFGVWWETALAERIPPHLLSRVSSYDWMGSLALLPLGYVLSGVIGDAIGAPQTLAAGSAICLAALALGLLPRDTRTLPRFEPGAAGMATSPQAAAVVAPERP